MSANLKEGKAHFVVDSIRVKLLEGQLIEDGKLYAVEGYAFHAVVTQHPGEPARLYPLVKDEIIEKVPTLVNKHFDVDHNGVYLNPTANYIRLAWWDNEKEGIYFQGQVDAFYARLIQNGAPVSIDINWFIPGGGVKVAQMNGVQGVVPFGFEYAGLSVLTDAMVPGDPNAQIALMQEAVSQVVSQVSKISHEQEANEMSEEENKILKGKLEESNKKIVEAEESNKKLVAANETLESEKKKLEEEKAAFEKEKQDMLEGKIETPALVEARKALNDVNAKLLEANKETLTAQVSGANKITALREGIIAVLPSENVAATWRPGAKIFVNQVKTVLARNNN